MGDHAEFGRQNNLVPSIGDRLPDQHLICERTVDLGSIDEGDAQVERPMDSAD
jgi:hypothetical protein